MSTDKIAPGAPPAKGGHEISLGAPPKPARGAGPSFAKPPDKPAKPKAGDSGLRETVETVVFVVVLVLLLKTFLAEAFVIPTGSMATTLLGYHLDVTCDKCGYRYVVNASGADEGRRTMIATYCENCQEYNPAPGAHGARAP